MLRGKAVRNLDDKNRIVIPARMRTTFQDNIFSVLVNDEKYPYLKFYDPDRWEERYKDINFDEISTEEGQNILPDYSKDIDSQGRILLNGKELEHLFGSGYKNINNKNVLFV